jgi:hypothetical protein
MKTCLRLGRAPARDAGHVLEKKLKSHDLSFFSTLVRPQGLEHYMFGTPFGRILPLVESFSKGLRALTNSPPDCSEGGQSPLRFNCPPSRARTLDRLLKRELLYQLS